MPTIFPAARRRVLVVLAVSLLAAAGAAVAVTLAMGSDGSQGAASGPMTVKPLSGRPPLILDVPGISPGSSPQAVLAAAAALPEGDPRRRWPERRRGTTRLTRTGRSRPLRALPSSDAAAVFNLGLAELWAGRRADALADLRRARTLDPYGFYGGRADDTLHPEQVRWYPLYFAPGALAAPRSVAASGRPRAGRTPTGPISGWRWPAAREQRPCCRDRRGPAGGAGRSHRRRRRGWRWPCSAMTRTAQRSRWERSPSFSSSTRATSRSASTAAFCCSGCG